MAEIETATGTAVAVQDNKGNNDGITSVPESLVRYGKSLMIQPGVNTSISDNVESKVDLKKPPMSVDKCTSGSVQTDEILDSIIPARQWNQGDKSVWMQYCSKATASRLDVINLQEQLDKRLMARQARDTGICPVREDLYQQCFDELIRQVTLNQPERGLLTLRVRDEIKMTIDAYKTLYESSVIFGVRKQLQAEEGMGEMESKIKQLEEECKEKENQVLELSNKVEIIEKRDAEVRALLAKKRKEEVDFLKYQGQNLDQFLKSISGGL